MPWAGTKTLVALAGVILGLADGRAEILWQGHAQRMIDQAVSIPVRTFSEGQVVRLCLSFLNAHRGDVVARYIIATDAQDALSNLRGKGVTDVTYQGWRNWYLQQPEQVPATAELIRVVDRAAVRIRFSDGRIVEHVIQGPSPFRVTFRGEVVRLLAVAPARMYGLRWVSSDPVEFFLQAPRPWNVQTAEAFSRMLREWTGVPIVANIEDGWWFATETNYPIYNRFLPHLEPPTFEEFKRHTRFHCTPGGSCLQTGPARR